MTLGLVATMKELIYVQSEVLGTEMGTISRRRYGRRAVTPRAGTVHLVWMGPKVDFVTLDNWHDQSFC